MFLLDPVLYCIPALFPRADSGQSFPHTLAQRRYLLGRAVLVTPEAGMESLLWEEEAHCKGPTNQSKALEA